MVCYYFLKFLIMYWEKIFWEYICMVFIFVKFDKYIGIRVRFKFCVGDYMDMVGCYSS